MGRELGGPHQLLTGGQTKVPSDGWHKEGPVRLGCEFQTFPRNSWTGEGSLPCSETEFTGKGGTRVHLSLS